MLWLMKKRFLISQKKKNLRTNDNIQKIVTGQKNDYTTSFLLHYLYFEEHYKMIQKVVTGQKDDYTTGCLLHYPYFEENYKMIAIGLCKQQALLPSPKATQQINCTWNLYRDFITEEAKEITLDFSQGTVRVS